MNNAKNISLLFFLFLFNTSIVANCTSAEEILIHALDKELAGNNNSEAKGIITSITKAISSVADVLILIYMAADNDLRSFAIRNIKQMMAVGSNKNVHIVIHIDIRDINNTKVTRRYYIAKNECIPLNENDPQTQCMDSGNPETLISFVDMATSLFPAKTVHLFFWDHGTGYLDPIHRHRINPSTLFTFNPKNCKLELERAIPYLSFSPEEQNIYRGVCWDQTTKNFLSSEKLAHALDTMCRKSLKSKRFSIIGFDACLMSMIEMADLLAPYADILVGSEEAILGTGFDYTKMLTPLVAQSINPATFATHIVESFKLTYARLTQDFALSAFDLEGTAFLTQNLDNVAHYLLTCLENQNNGSVKRALQNARKATVHFNEPSYLDYYDLYTNILNTLKNFDLASNSATKTVLKDLEKALKTGQSYIRSYMIANAVGQKLVPAQGLSLYFPERMHSSYPNSAFAKSNAWSKFVQKYILS